MHNERLFLNLAVACLILSIGIVLLLIFEVKNIFKENKDLHEKN